MQHWQQHLDKLERIRLLLLDVDGVTAYVFEENRSFWVGLLLVHHQELFGVWREFSLYCRA